MNSVNVSKFLIMAKVRNATKNYFATSMKLATEVGVLVIMIVVASIVSKMTISDEHIIVASIIIFTLIGAYFIFLPKLSPFTISLEHLEFLYMTPKYFFAMLTVKIVLVNLHLLIYALLYMFIDLMFIDLPEQFHWVTVYCFLASLTNTAWIRFHLAKKKAILLQLFSVVIILFSVLVANYLTLYWLIVLVISAAYAIKTNQHIDYEKYRRACKLTTLHTKYFFAGDFVGLMSLAQDMKEEKVINSIEFGKFYYKGWKSIIVKDFVAYLRRPKFNSLVMLAQICLGVYIIYYKEQFAIAGIWVIMITLMGVFAEGYRKTTNKISKGFMYPLTSKEILLGSIVIPVILTAITLSAILIFISPSFLIARLIILNMSITIAIPLLAFFKISDTLNNESTPQEGRFVHKVVRKGLIYLGMSVIAVVLKGLLL